MIDKDFEKKILEDLKVRLTEEKFCHSLSTAKTSVKLAERWNGDAPKCYLAGLIHDCGKLKDKDTILNECLKYKITLTEEDLKSPQVIHSYLSEAIAREEYKIEDIEILKAVRNHTLGNNDMSLTEKIIFLADTIEPERGNEKIYQSVRELAYKNIDEAVLLSYKNSIEYNKKHDRHIHKEALNHMESLERKMKECTLK